MSAVLVTLFTATVCAADATVSGFDKVHKLSLMRVNSLKMELTGDFNKTKNVRI